jgi:DNA-binding PadR family transcriptional regulator
LRANSRPARVRSKSFWGESENNRRAKYYRRTKAGERQLGVETEQWTTISRAIGHALKTT